MVLATWLLSLGMNAAAAELTLTLPLGRAAYQTNERIDLAVARAAAANEALAAGELTLTVAGEADGSALTFQFAVRAAAPGEDGTARATEHLHLNGALLRPGRYTLTVGCDGAEASAPLEVHSHLRRSSFVIGDWPHAYNAGERIQAMGEDSLGFNVTFRNVGVNNATVRGALDNLRGMALGGAHQLDGNLKNDWSDPYVLREGRLRASRQALRDRTQPNCIGVHFYDEPGLTWNEHPETKMFGPFNIAAQDRAWKGSYFEDAQQYHKVDPQDAASLERWREQQRWKLRFMEACWRHISTGVNLVRPDWLTATQTQYGWDAFSDGYYFNIARHLPVIVGHGWYSDCYWLNLAPPMASEFGRVRDWNRPLWYLPTWWQMNLPHARMQQATSFVQNLQGMFWPTNTPWAPSTDHGIEGIVEMNRLMLRVGTVFTTLPVERPPAALLYSLSQGIEAQIRSGMKDFRYANGHLRTTEAFYAAGMRNQVPLFPVVEEDILDGTLAARHPVVILSKVEFLEPSVVSALEDYIAAGGKVLLDNECTVTVKGAEKLGLQMDYDFHNRAQSVAGAPNRAIYTSHNFMKSVEGLARDLRRKLAGYGIQPVFACDSLDILGRRQAGGDIEYLFAVNMRTDPDIERQNTVRGTTATIGVPADGRPLYDAILGGEAAGFVKKGQELAATVRFGPGQMRIWARTARPIGGVQVDPPAVVRDYVDRPAQPVSVEIAAVLVDAAGATLAGAAPMQVRLIDPLGDVRYELWRATDRGRLRLALPLAANDPEGEWTVEVTELLAGHTGRHTFRLAQPKAAGAVAGMTSRAALFGPDADRAYDFFRRHRDVQIVTGASPYNAAAAAHLAEHLGLWGVRAAIVPAADVKPRTVPEAAVRLSLSWENGFAIEQPCILLGNPDDNPVIRFIVEGARTAMMAPANLLPYRPQPERFPGRGRGFVAWQVDAVAHGLESLTCIAYDEAGMKEAVGSLFEAASGLAPLTAWTPPARSRVAPATAKRQTTPALSVAWTAHVPDRALGVAAFADGRVAVCSYDGTVTVFDAAGKTLWQQATDRSGEYLGFAASADGRTLAVCGGVAIVGFDGATGKELFDVKAYPDDRRQFVLSLAVTADGETVYAGTEDSAVLALDRKGKPRWFAQEPAAKAYADGQVAFGKAMAEWEKKKDANAPKPNPPAGVKFHRYQSLVLATDGRTLFAAAPSGAHLYQADTGALLGGVGGVNGAFPVLADGDGFLAHDGRHALQRVSVAEKKVLQSTALPGSPVVALARAGDGWLVGTESDSSVCRIGPLQEKADVRWTHQRPTRVVKHLYPAGERTAALYWGGTVTLLDAQGAVVAESLFPQDVAAAAVAGDLFVCALADGRVVALRLPR
jgi:hypothetical protein